jgi:hypothetical protein
LVEISEVRNGVFPLILMEHTTLGDREAEGMISVKSRRRFGVNIEKL